MSTLFLRTLRADPADAEVPSHKLLVRAGYVRRVAPGIYSWLPLGLKVLRNIEAVVREEMDQIAQEVQFPALLPRDVYDTTGRWTEYGDNLFRLKDRKGNDYLLGPTHEEMFTLMVKSECTSYKDLPVSLYQIQNKYRDEARPRAGILRGREFLMKDSYSFDLDDEGLKASYEAHRATYVKIFDRLGMDYRVVSAVSGAMGGSASEEFLAIAPTGEDSFVSCTACDYAANVEAVETRAAAVTGQQPAIEVMDTPDTPTIESLATFLGITAGETLKNVVVKLQQPDGTVTALVVGVPGDREIDMKRLEANVAPAEVIAFEGEDFAKHPGLVRGYIGPQGSLGVRYVVDPLVAEGSAWVTGANAVGKHARNVVMGRDFTPDGFLAAAEVRAGDPCPRCGSPLSLDRGIEIGHVFQLGRKYADAFNLEVLGPEGKPVRVTMGSYGVGVSRAVAVIAEQSHDESGLIWPRSIAPADVHVVIAGQGEQKEGGLALATSLEAAGLRVLLDDRHKVSPGVAFKDAELIGIPTYVVVGKNLAAEGTVEIRDRRSGSSRTVAIASAVEEIVNEVRA